MPPTKKKRTTNPGVRIQGGRIYDSNSGTTCHQCRQKTAEAKAKCTECTLYWCPRCLLNRYGEHVEKVAELKEWSCPRCRKECNCSNCRKRNGLEATGILANVCKTAGMSSVAELLTKNPTAKRSALPPAMPKPQEAKPGKPAKKAKEVVPPVREFVPDSTLGEFLKPFPAAVELALQKRGSGKRMRGVSWPNNLKDPCPIPPDCSPGDLAEVLEFVKVFGQDFNFEVADLACFAAELVQTEGRESAFAADHLSPVGKIHQALLDLVRNDWGIKGSVGLHGWQKIMQAYLKQDRLEGRAKLVSVAQIAGSPKDIDLLQMDTTDDTPASPGVVSDNDVLDLLSQYPEGGYWNLAPGVRLRMLRALCHDALATSTIRERMENALSESAGARKEKREEEAAARKEAKKAWQEERNQHIARLLTGGNALTLEEQRALMDSAKPMTQPTANVGDMTGNVEHPALRLLPLGEDRSGCCYWKLQSGGVLAGPDSILAAKVWRTPRTDHWVAYSNISQIVACLDSRGLCESRLRENICKQFSMK